MELESYKFSIVILLTVGFGLASLLGYLSQYLKLSPILGYLVAGYIIGPYSPGFVAEAQVAEQLAEIGVILMMLGVGLHFRWEDLDSVKSIAITGAIIQLLGSTLLGTLLAYAIGWSITTGIILGVAIGVTSTVVMMRMLTDNNLINTQQGNIAVGWLVIEDICTVIFLLLLPSIALISQGEQLSISSIATSILFVLAKFIVLAFLMLILGQKAVSYILFKVARLRSHELLSLVILALTFIIATGSAYLFGTSIALGAFIAGMVIGHTAVRHQASVNSSTIRDAFVVIFFLSVGMIFNPLAIVDYPFLFVGVFFLIMIMKPLIAIAITLLMRYPFNTALIIGAALAQIGEFSFILAEEALKLNLLPDEGYDIIVACALLSISLNPLLFRAISCFQAYMIRKGWFSGAKKQQYHTDIIHKALVIGFGPLGQKVSETLEKIGYNPLVIDQNIDAILARTEIKKPAVYGDASQHEIMAAVHVETAKLLVITVPETEATINIIDAVRNLNPNIEILARTRYLKEQHLVQERKINYLWCEEEEAIKAFDHALFRYTRY